MIVIQSFAHFFQITQNPARSSAHARTQVHTGYLDAHAYARMYGHVYARGNPCRACMGSRMRLIPKPVDSNCRFWYWESITYIVSPKIIAKKLGNGIPMPISLPRHSTERHLFLNLMTIRTMRPPKGSAQVWRVTRIRADRRMLILRLSTNHS